MLEWLGTEQPAIPEFKILEKIIVDLTISMIVSESKVIVRNDQTLTHTKEVTQGDENG